MTSEQRGELEAGFRTLCHNDAAWQQFASDVAASVRLYMQMRAIAEKSSAGAVRSNLGQARRAGQRFLKAVNQLDGNSLRLLPGLTPGTTIKGDVAKLVLRLSKAEQYARQHYKAGGRRPQPERDNLAALLLRALRTHTLVQPTSTEGKPFEMLLKLATAFAGERHSDLHRRAKRALAGVVLIEESGGILSISAPIEPKNRRLRP